MQKFSDRRVKEMRGHLPVITATVMRLSGGPCLRVMVTGSCAMLAVVTKL